MEDWDFLKVLLFFTCSVHLSGAVPHSLQYIYTAIIPTLNCTAVGLVNGEQIVYYDSSTKKMITKTEWVKMIKSVDPQYWKIQTQHMQNQQERFQDNLEEVMQIFGHAKGVHTLLKVYGCEIGENSTFSGHYQYSYDQKDFFHLDLKTGTWTPADEKAEIFIKWWDPKGDNAKYWKDFLETDCVDWLKKYPNNGIQVWQHKVSPKTFLFQKESSPPEVVCDATGFFPKALNISWRKDGEDVHLDVDLRETLPNQDGSFQKRSILKVSAEELQKHTYTCVIEHSSLEKDLVLPVSERRILRDGGSGGGSDGGQIGIIVGISVALVVLVVAGIVVWKKKNSGFKPVLPKPSSEGDSSSNNS
ncbi:BOLA class I histocompatibility antigen, alpha chain BL3-7-like isoform X1 [Silurus meridionalis]|uniref:BOLA class I histocompatibility antigen, alpha chain BL3-7-like isoform X1 n=1 Tax=Silurus meridionalis TaxID=175797 RepID=UPI001EEBABAE|nr:BOLA class I histocompatibility antigen, alpha chain BL3-7-like isoform X1 [Silurus meridionalis]